MCIKIAIADDHPMIVDGLQNALSLYDDIMVCNTYHFGTDLLKGLKENIPDVLLLDIQLPDIAGYELAQEIVRDYPEVKILVFSGVESQLVVQDMMKVGCRGYLQKTTTNKELLVSAIREVHNGGIFLEPDLQKQLLQNVLVPNPKIQNFNKQLTVREKEVLQLIAREYTNQQIAERLFISIRTVQSHRYNLLQKLDVKNAVGLIKAAIQMGLMD